MASTATSLSFDFEARFRPFDLVAPGFVGVTRSDVGQCGSLQVSDDAPVAPFTAVELDVTETGDGTILLGLVEPDGDHVLACYDHGRGQVGIEVRVGGVTTRVRERAAPEEPAQRLAFVLCENRVTLLEDVGAGWRHLVSERARVGELLDLRRPEVLGRLRSAWGVRDGRARFGDVRAGLFGMAGLRDLHLVQHSDGRPYERDGRMFLTATCAGLGFFQQAHWGVFALDPHDPTHLEHVAQLFTRRDGLVLGDHAGQLVRDENDRAWLVATSSWGDFTPDRGVHVRHTTTDADLLRGVHLLETVRTPLPTDVGSWDPALTRIDGRWHVGFVESPSQKPFDFHPALAAADPGDDWTAGLTRVGAADDLHHCEGPILARVGDEWTLLASDGEHRTYPVFDLRMRKVGELDAPYGSNIPHPQVYERPDGRWGLITFDGTAFAEEGLGYGTHGDVVVMSSVARGRRSAARRRAKTLAGRVRRRLTRVGPAQRSSPG